MAIPVVESSSGRASASTSSLVGDKPTGTADGDLLVAFVSWGTSVTFSSAPSGWTQAGSEVVNGVAGVRLRAYWKVASSEGSTWTWTVSGSTSGIVTVARVSGFDATTQIDTTAGTVDDARFDSLSKCDGITTGVDNCLVLTGHGVKAGATFTPHASTTELQDLSIVGSRAAMMCSEDRASSGATGSRDAPLSISEASVSFCVSVRPVPAASSNAPSLLLAA